MQIGVLGPLEVLSEGERLALGGPKQRLVLGLLVAWRGRVVTVDELIDGLWPEGPQDRPRKTVQVYITRLRRTLGVSGDPIRSEAAGYVLDSSVLPVDADGFEQAAQPAGGQSDDRAAIAALRAALDLWRGDAFADLRECPSIVPSAVRLDELRIAARFDLYEREIRVNPRGVIAELEQAVESHPLHEGFAAQLMTAEYRAGRQADALATYQALRRRLADELGLDPGPEVRELEGRILRHELDIAAPPAPLAPERQRRVVSIVAAELTLRAGDAPLDPEDELTIAAPVRRAARARLRDGGGVVLAEHGEMLTACFGYPSAERSVERAVLAALAVRDVARAVADEIDVRVGVDTGVVVVESPGEAEGRSSELTGIAGEPLRAAARLARGGRPGDVSIGPTTADAVHGLFELADAEGDPTARRAWVVLGPAPSSAGGRDVLLGREAARRELAEICEHADERLCTVAVYGPPGVGKSAIVDAWLAELDDSWSVIRLYCDSRQSATPLHPLRSFLPDLFVGDGEPSTRAVVAALTERWSGSRPVLVVEDLHAADPSTLELLGELPQRLAAGLVVVTSRDAGPVELGGELVPGIALGPLDRATARRLAAEIAGPGRLRLDTLNEIADRSGGTPLHVVALTRAVIDADAVGGKASVPTSLYDSLMSRLDQLGPARAFAQRCAVLGESFRRADVALLEGGDAESDQHLARMLRAGVLTDDGDGRYRFTHALVADAAYESLLNSERAALHGRVAAGLPRELARAEPERLAFHLEAAGRTFEAAVEWRRASANAIRRAHHREAQRHARQALALLDRLGPDGTPDGGDTRRRALTNLAIGLQATGHGSAELLDVVAAARASGVDADFGRKMFLDVIDVSNRQALGDFAGATDIARGSLAAAEAAGDELWTAFARQFLGATLVWRGELAAGVEELDLAGAYWDRAEHIGMVNARPVGALWVLLGLAAFVADRPVEAEHLFARSRDSIPDADGYGRCLVATTAAVADQLAGRPDDVRRAVEPVWSLAMDLGSDFWLGWAQVLLGWAIAADGERTGLAMMAEAIDAATTRQAAPYFAYLLGSRMCEVGQRDAGLERLDRGLAVGAETGEQLWVPLLHLERARWLGADDATKAASAATDAATAMGAALILRRVDEWRAARSGR